MNAMTLLVFIAAAAVVVSLASGLTSMAHGGPSDQLHAHEHMFQRVGWQALAVALVLLAMLSQLD
jgi:hypothetical protein